MSAVEFLLRVVDALERLSVPYMVVGSFSSNRIRFGRRLRGAVGGRQVFMPTAEDVVVTKLRWSRHGRRHKDVDDVRNVLAVQGRRLDLEYIRQWCDQHGTRELLDRLLTEAEVTGQ